MDFQIGEPVNIIAGEYAGLGGEVVALYEGGCEVLVGGYRLPMAIDDLAPDLRMVAAEALDFLGALRGHDDNAARHHLVARLGAALTP